MSDEQWGFRPGGSAIDLIFLLSEVLERRRECKKKSFICFIDVIKAYGTVWIDGLFVKLRKVGVRGKMWRVLLDWNWGGRSVVGVDTSGIDTNDFELKQGVNQGSVVAALLYALFVDRVDDGVKKRRVRSDRGGNVGRCLVVCG